MTARGTGTTSPRDRCALPSFGINARAVSRFVSSAASACGQRPFRAGAYRRPATSRRQRVPRSSDCPPGRLAAGRGRGGGRSTTCRRRATRSARRPRSVSRARRSPDVPERLLGRERFDVSSQPDTAVPERRDRLREARVAGELSRDGLAGTEHHAEVLDGQKVAHRIRALGTRSVRLGLARRNASLV
jgi:hypothetical protein